MSTLQINNDPVWELPPPAPSVIQFRVERNTLIAIIVSVLLHLLLLWQVAPKLFSMGSPDKQKQPLQITLGPPQKKEVMPKESSIPEKSAKAHKSKKTLESPQQTPMLPNPEAIPRHETTPSDFSLPKPTDKPRPSNPENSAQPLPGEDMQSYIRRQKLARMAAQGYSKQDVDEAMENAQSAGEKRDAAIKENMNLNGTNGIFEIRALGQHTAQFSFKGWKNNVNNARLEVIDVTAPDGMDIRHAVVRKMIEIIRREYSGEFNFDSQRLQRVVVLSARPEDNEALEGFMMNEFFGSGSRVR
jgi:hypothetical protein